MTSLGHDHDDQPEEDILCSGGHWFVPVAEYRNSPDEPRPDYIDVECERSGCDERERHERGSRLYERFFAE